MRLAPYRESYSRTAFEWLPSMPSHWHIKRAKLILREVDLRSVTGKETLLSVSQYTGVTPRKNRDYSDVQDTRSESLVGYKKVSSGDLVVNIMLAWNGSLGASKFDGVVSPAYCVYRLEGDNHPDYYHHLLRTEAYKGRIKVDSRGVVDSRLRLYSENLFRIELPVPPPDEQAQIVRFIRHLDQRVNRLIKAKRRLIELLNEQKQAIIHRAVTRGLDPAVPLKPSGIDWLGDVPEHWCVKRVRHIAEMLVSNVDKHSHEHEVPVRLCNYVDVYKNEAITDQLKFMVATASEDEVDRFRIQIGDVVITKDSELWSDIGVPAVVRYQADDLVCGYHLAILRPKQSELNGEFLLRCLQDRLIATQLHVAANGITRYGLSQGSIKSCLIPVPPVDEQEELVAHLLEATRDLTLAISKAQSEMDLIREYRTRLVADVVTGQLDVRGVVIPDESDDGAPGDDVPDLGSLEGFDGDDEFGDEESLEETLA